MPVFALFVEHASGYTQVLTFPTAYERALWMIGLASQPVRLRTADYAHDGLTDDVRALEAIYAL